jgi:hypothetical protein
MNFLALHDDAKFIIATHLASDLKIRALLSKNHDLQQILFGDVYTHTYTEEVDAGIVLVLPQRLQCDADGRNGRLHEHLDERVLLGAHALALCAFVVGTYLLVPWGKNGEAFAKLDLFQRTQLAELPPHKAVIQRHLFLPRETCLFARRGPISCKRDLLVSKKTYHLTKAYHGQNKKTP